MNNGTTRPLAHVLSQGMATRALACKLARSKATRTPSYDNVVAYLEAAANLQANEIVIHFVGANETKVRGVAHRLRLQGFYVNVKETELSIYIPEK